MTPPLLTVVLVAVPPVEAYRRPPKLTMVSSAMPPFNIVMLPSSTMPLLSWPVEIV